MNNGTFRLPAGTSIERISLRVRSLEQSLAFYAGLLGFRETRREGSTVFLAASGTPLILLTEQQDAPPRSRRSPGLF
ncbi:MAG TPA: VOC family protein, partial [Bacteroidota bacterium]